LNGDISAKEILSAVLPKLEVRKFEFVEPSLNSIFLEVVGATVEEVEKEKNEVLQSQRAAVSLLTNPEIKKQQRSFLGGIALAIVCLILSLAGKNLWGFAGAGGLLAIVSYIRLQKAKQKMRLESNHE
jgi:hypothetical protein